MSVEAPFFQAYLLHHRPDAAAVPAALAERASGHGKNFFVVLRFVFRRVSHRVRVRSYSNPVKTVYSSTLTCWRSFRRPVRLIRIG
jgi:transglutaminase-like putative cysteine protease